MVRTLISAIKKIDSGLQWPALRNPVQSMSQGRQQSPKVIFPVLFRAVSELPTLLEISANHSHWLTASVVALAAAWSGLRWRLQRAPGRTGGTDPVSLQAAGALRRSGSMRAVPPGHRRHLSERPGWDDRSGRSGQRKIWTRPAPSSRKALPSCGFGQLL